MQKISTGALHGPTDLSTGDNLQVYCGLDCCITLEIREVLEELFPSTPVTYAFERALQGPYLEIMQRGFRVNETARRSAASALRERRDNLEAMLNEFAFAVWDKPLNPRSPKQLADFFFKSMRLPEVWLSQKGQRKLSTNREALEKLETYLYARPFIACILAIRDIGKQLDVFEQEIDKDGRFRAAYNIAGTETGRPSSSENAFGTGGNAQNIATPLRYVFEADFGKKMAVIDLEQVEARDVGFFCGSLFDDWSLLDACECITEDHEVLTKDGWVSIAKQPEKIATWSNGEIRFEPVLKWNTGTTQQLIEIKNQSISIKGTRNHSMPIIADRSKKVEKRTLENILLHPNFAAPNTGILRNNGLIIRSVELLAAFQADGTRDSQGRVHWTFTKKRKIEVMRTMLNELGYAYSEYSLGNGNTRFYLKKGQGQENWKKECGAEITSWSLETLKRFCSSHSIWDGSWENNQLSITAKSKSHLEWLAVAYTFIGNAVSLRPHKKEYWELTIKKHKNHQYRSAQFKEIEIKEGAKVYCPTVADSFFLVKRDNKIFISGNSGDLHTNNAMRIWPERDWGKTPKENRQKADENFYREYSYRDMAKRGSHLSNYYGTPWMMARSLKIPQQLAVDFQDRYIRGANAAFPCIAKWWQWTAQQLDTQQQLVTPFGRRRHFFGRPGDETTLREAIAFLPQSTTADRMNLGMWRVWRYAPEVQLLAQTYDSITFQYDENADEDAIIRKVLKLLEVELFCRGRRYVVPAEAKVGWNWGPRHDDSKPFGPGNRPNPNGLVKYKLGKPDTRQRQRGLQQVIR